MDDITSDKITITDGTSTITTTGGTTTGYIATAGISLAEFKMFMEGMLHGLHGRPLTQDDLDLIQEKMDQVRETQTYQPQPYVPYTPPFEPYKPFEPYDPNAPWITPTICKNDSGTPPPDLGYSICCANTNLGLVPN